MVEKTVYKDTYVVDCVEAGKKRAPPPLSALQRAGEMGCYVTLAVKRDLQGLPVLDFSSGSVLRKVSQAKAFARELLQHIVEHFEGDRKESDKIHTKLDEVAKQPHTAKTYKKIEMMQKESGADGFDPKREAGDRTALLIQIMRDPESALTPFHEGTCTIYQIHLLSNQLAHGINPKDPDKEDGTLPRTLIQHGVVKALLGRLNEISGGERDYREWAAILGVFNNLSRFNHDTLGPELRTLILEGGFDFALIIALQSKDHWVRRIAEGAFEALENFDAWDYRCFVCKEVMYKEIEDDSEKKLQWCTSCHCRAYCSKECQKISWKAGHREECKRFSKI